MWAPFCLNSASVAHSPRGRRGSFSFLPSFKKTQTKTQISIKIYCFKEGLGGVPHWICLISSYKGRAEASVEQSEAQKGLMTAALRGRSRTRRGELGGETEPCRSGGIPQRRDSALSCGRLGFVCRPAWSRKAPEKAFTGRGSQGLPAAASPVPSAHRGCCRRTRDLRRAAHAESVLWRREGERAEFEGR